MVQRLNSLTGQVTKMESNIGKETNELSTVDFVQTYRFLVGKVYNLDNEYLSKLQMVRKMLSCSVCDEVVQQPYSVPGCDHLSCKKCIGCSKQSNRVKGCVNESCQDWTKHEVDELVLCYVGMFKDLCKFICTTNAIRTYIKTQYHPCSLWSIVKEGALIDVESNPCIIIKDSPSDSEDSVDSVDPLASCEAGSFQGPVSSVARDTTSVVPVSSGYVVEENLTEERLSNGVEVEFRIKLEPSAEETDPLASPKRASSSATELLRNGEAHSNLRTGAGNDPLNNYRIANSGFNKPVNDESGQLSLGSTTYFMQSSSPETHGNTVMGEEATQFQSPDAKSRKILMHHPVSTFSASSVDPQLDAVKAKSVAMSSTKLKTSLPPPSSNRPSKARKGCRCGNTSAVPGKLTCCGQRCPCYVESKGCKTCKCKGCRNPYIQGGRKLLPGLHAVIGGGSNSAVRIHTPHMGPMITAGGEIIYGGIRATPTFTQLYPVSTVASFGGFSMPLPIISVSQQNGNPHETDRLSHGGGLNPTQTYAVNF